MISWLVGHFYKLYSRVRSFFRRDIPFSENKDLVDLARIAPTLPTLPKYGYYVSDNPDKTLGKFTDDDLDVFVGCLAQLTVEEDHHGEDGTLQMDYELQNGVAKPEEYKPEVIEVSYEGPEELIDSSDEFFGEN